MEKFVPLHSFGQCLDSPLANSFTCPTSLTNVLIHPSPLANVLTRPTPLADVLTRPITLANNVLTRPTHLADVLTRHSPPPFFAKHIKKYTSRDLARLHRPKYPATDVTHT